MSNPNQDKIDRAYDEEVEKEKNTGIIEGVLTDIASIFVPEGLKSDEQKARDRAREDVRTGKK